MTGLRRIGDDSGGQSEDPDSEESKTGIDESAETGGDTLDSINGWSSEVSALTHSGTIDPNTGLGAVVDNALPDSTFGSVVVTGFRLVTDAGTIIDTVRDKFNPLDLDPDNTPEVVPQPGGYE